MWTLKCDLWSSYDWGVRIYDRPADSNYSPNTNATDNSPLIDLVINATHRYAATKGFLERLDLSWWHFTCIMHQHSPNEAEEQAEEVQGDTLQKYTDQIVKYNPDV